MKTIITLLIVTGLLLTAQGIALNKLATEKSYWDSIATQKENETKKFIFSNMDVLYECGENLEFACSSKRGNLGKFIDLF